jgi:hypothetical protein
MKPSPQNLPLFDAPNVPNSVHEYEQKLKREAHGIRELPTTLPPKIEELRQIRDETAANNEEANSTNETLRENVRKILARWHGSKDKKPHWWSVQALRKELTYGTETSISSACRDLRKPKNGGHTVLPRRLPKSVTEYLLLPDGMKEGDL